MGAGFRVGELPLVHDRLATRITVGVKMALLISTVGCREQLWDLMKRPKSPPPVWKAKPPDDDSVTP